MTIFVILSLPAFSALICFVMYSYPKKEIHSGNEKQAVVSLSGYLLTTFFSWIGFALFFYRPHPAQELFFFWYALLVLIQVFFYQFVFILTRLPGDKPFAMWHYMFPVLVFLIIAWLWRQTGQPEAYGFMSPYFIYGLSHALCLILSYLRVKRYRLHVENYASQLHQSYMGWLDILIISSVILIIFSVSLFFISEGIAVSVKWLVFPVAILVMQPILIVYNILIRNYIILEDVSEEEVPETVVVNGDRTNIKIPEKKEFERFFAEEKPYIDKDLKITDLARQLSSNRTYLSYFINSTYGMNFSSFINERRLYYLEELRTNPAMKDKTNIELIHLAGFGSYQSYLRAKEKEAKNSILKV